MKYHNDKVNRLVVACIVLIAVFISSCYSYKHKHRYRHKYKDEYGYARCYKGITGYTSFVYFSIFKWQIGHPYHDEDTIFCIPIDNYDIITVKERAITDVFKIVDIKKINWIYVIQVQKDSLCHYRYFNEKDSSFRDVYSYPAYEIFSTEVEKIKGCEKIKVGKKYELTLNPYFEYDFFSRYKYNTLDNRFPRAVDIKGKHIGIYSVEPNIYTTSNIDGLYYIPEITNNQINK